jgi:hypothetical protein
MRLHVGDYVAEVHAPGGADATIAGAEPGQLFDGGGSLDLLGGVTGDGLLGGILGYSADLGGIDLGQTLDLGNTLDNVT